MIDLTNVKKKYLTVRIYWRINAELETGRAFRFGLGFGPASSLSSKKFLGRFRARVVILGFLRPNSSNLAFLKAFG